MRTLIYGGTIINEGQQFIGSIIIDGDRISEISETTDKPRGLFDREVDATGCLVIPGVIDTHVHFREPGLTHKADIYSESRAAALGGVTSYFDMPNTVPQTTSIDTLEEKFRLGQEKSLVNYSFFIGATNDNLDQLQHIDKQRIPGVKVFMGSSTGNMLVDKAEALERLFAFAAKEDIQLMAHCEDTDTINSNMAYYKAQTNTDDPDVRLHPLIRSWEACEKSTHLGVELATKHHCRFHVAHISTEQEISNIIDGIALGGYRDNGLPNITAEATVAHLVFSLADYERYGTRIKCNPAVKSLHDKLALRQAITEGWIKTIGTDHAPHSITEKQGGAAKAVSGMPMVQFSLPQMLSLVSENDLGWELTIEELVYLMCHNPAQLFDVKERGYLRQGYKADIAIVKPESWTVTPECIASKCGWSPLEGRELKWKVAHTFCNGHHVNDNGHLDTDYRGEEIAFDR